MKMHKTLGMAALIVTWSIGSETATASNQDNDAAVVTVLAPVFLTPTSATPLRQLPAGTVVRVVSTDAEWCRIEFNDLQLGRRIGFIRTRNLRTNAPTPRATIPLPRPSPPSGESGSVAGRGSPQNSSAAASSRLAAVLREPRLTNEVSGCRDDLAALVKAVQEASSTAEHAIEAEDEFEDIKDDLDDAVENEGRTCKGAADRSYSCSQARDEARTLKAKLVAADGTLRAQAIELAEAVDEARQKMARTVSACNAAVGTPDVIPGVRDQNQAVCRIFMRMRDMEGSPLFANAATLGECLNPRSGLSAEECRICAAR